MFYHYAEKDSSSYPESTIKMSSNEQDSVQQTMTQTSSSMTTSLPSSHSTTFDSELESSSLSKYAIQLFPVV